MSYPQLSNLNIQFPNFNVPPPSTNKIPIPGVSYAIVPPCQSSSGQTPSHIHVQNNDQSIIDEFLQRKGYNLDKIDSNNVTAVIKKKYIPRISDATKLINECFTRIELIKQIESDLRSKTADLSQTEWELQINQIILTRRSLSNNIEILKDPDYIRALKTVIKKRKNRRRRLKIIKERQKTDHEIDRRSRTELHIKIDAWQNEKKLEILKEKQKQLEAEYTADVLGDVVKRINEAKKNLLLFDNLKELRRVRKVAAGENDLGEKDFNGKIESLKSVWEDVLSEYEEEKVKLKNFLEQKIQTPVTMENLWLEALFGHDSLQNTKNPYLLADRDVECFLNIRQLWDEFIVSDDDVGSGIPLGWVTPNANPSPGWETFKTKLDQK